LQRIEILFMEKKVEDLK